MVRRAIAALRAPRGATADEVAAQLARAAAAHELAVSLGGAGCALPGGGAAACPPPHVVRAALARGVACGELELVGNNRFALARRGENARADATPTKRAAAARARKRSPRAARPPRGEQLRRRALGALLGATSVPGHYGPAGGGGVGVPGHYGPAAGLGGAGMQSYLSVRHMR